MGRRGLGFRVGFVCRVGLAFGVGLASLAGAGVLSSPPFPTRSAEAGGGAATPRPAATGTLSGTVTDEEGQPFPGAEIRVTPEGQRDAARVKSGTSDAKGFYAVRGLEPGAYAVSVRSKGRVTVDDQVSVPATGIALFDVRLVPGVRYTGRVVDLEGRPVEGARVTAREDRGPQQGFFFFLSSESAPATTDKGGAFVLDGLEPTARYAVHVRHPRHLPAELPGLSGEAGGGLDDIEVLLEPAAWVTGTVTDMAGKPIPGARILAPSEDDAGWRTFDFGGMSVRVWFGGDDDGDLNDGPTKARADAAGRFEVGSLAPTEPGASLVLRARAKGYFPGEVKVADLVAGAARAGVTVRLEAGKAVVAGKVVDDAGAAVPGATVTASAPDAGELGTVKTDAAGRFRVEKVATRAKVTVSVRADGHERGHARDLAPDSLDNAVTVRRLGRLRLRVLGADGKPLPRVVVRVRLDARASDTDMPEDVGGRTDSTGTYAQPSEGLELRLPLGSLSVDVVAEGHVEQRVGEFTVEPGQTVDGGTVTLATK